MLTEVIYIKLIKNYIQKRKIKITFIFYNNTENDCFNYHKFYNYIVIRCIKIITVNIT